MRDEKIYIYYSTDSRLYKQLLISLISLANSTSATLIVYNLTCELPEYSQNKKLNNLQIKTCNTILNKKNKNSKFINIDVSQLVRKYLLVGPNIRNKYYKFGAFLSIRWLIDKINVPSKKIIWLDTDTIIMDNIELLWNLDINQYEILGCHDCIWKQRWMPRILSEMQTGVMLLNLDLLIKENTINKTIKMIQTKKMRNTDMTSINKQCKNIKFIDTKFNDYKFHDNTIIFHGCSYIKDKNKPGYFVKIDDKESMIQANPSIKWIYDELDKLEIY